MFELCENYGIIRCEYDGIEDVFSFDHELNGCKIDVNTSGNLISQVFINDKRKPNCNDLDELKAVIEKFINTNKSEIEIDIPKLCEKHGITNTEYKDGTFYFTHEVDNLHKISVYSNQCIDGNIHSKVYINCDIAELCSTLNELDTYIEKFIDNRKKEAATNQSINDNKNGADNGESDSDDSESDGFDFLDRFELTDEKEQDERFGS